jgi:hypothetical protein
MITQLDCLTADVKWASEWLLFNVKWAVFQYKCIFIDRWRQVSERVIELYWNTAHFTLNNNHSLAHLT